MPRVISGSARRLQLQTLKGAQTRPTADQTKETLFNILEARRSCRDLEVLELFAGSGQLAIEALSRGAKHAVLVEQSRKLQAIQEHNLQHTHLRAQAELRFEKARRVVQTLREEGRHFDLILADPPYAQAALHWGELKQFLVDLLAPEGILVWEQAAQEELDWHEDFSCWKHCHSGAAMLFFLSKPFESKGKEEENL